MKKARELECDPYFPKKGEEDLPFLFVSYAHQDVDKVKPIVDALHREGFRIWYDKQGSGIDYGAGWKEVIFERLDKSSAFLSFVSQHNEYRPIVIEEMATAIRKQRRAESCETGYPIVFVCLEKVSTKSFELGLSNKEKDSKKSKDYQEGSIEFGKEVQSFLNKNQFISYKQYGGLTERFMNELMNANWPIEIVDNEWRESVGKPPLRPGNRSKCDTSFIVDADDFSLLARFERTKVEDGFEIGGKTYPLYRCSPNQISRLVAYPTFLDNQWVPESLYSDSDFKEHGLRFESVQNKILRLQRREINRCLLNNWQMAINRAALWNSPVLSEWYEDSHPESKYFGDLLIEGAIIVCLLTEDAPNKHPRFDHSEETFRAWLAFCERLLSEDSNRALPTCLRLDWEEDQSNRFECNQLVAVPFQDFCLTTASNYGRLDLLCLALGVEESERNAFKQRWAAIRDDAVAWTSSYAQRFKNNELCYERERFYREFVIKERDSEGQGISVDAGIVDWEDKPFADKLKRIIDFQYTMNLPLALQIRPILPADARLQPYLIANSTTKQRRREVSCDELVYAFDQFEPALDARLYALNSDDVNLGLVCKMRGLPSWKKYMAAVSECMERSRLDHIDFSDAYRVWDLYGAFLQDARGLLRDCACDELESGALTVIARFEEHKVVVLYRPGTIKLAYSVGDKQISVDQLPWDSQKESSVPVELKRKVNLTISFVCGDATVKDWDSNPLLSEHLMFDGLTYDDGAQSIEAIIKRVALKRDHMVAWDAKR